MKFRKPTKFTTIETTWKGIFVTCNRGRELQCAREAQTWFETVVDEHFISESTPIVPADPTEEPLSVEEEIKKELAELNAKKKKIITTHVQLGVECVIFVQVRSPVDPVELTLKVCELARNGQHSTKYIQRMGPVQQFIKVDEELSHIESLKPLVERQLTSESKFAIRPTLRLSPITRERAIPAVAKLVGPGHKVSLTDFDQLILVEGFKGVFGLSVLDTPTVLVQEYCKFNLAQILARGTNE